MSRNGCVDVPVEGMKEKLALGGGRCRDLVFTIGRVTARCTVSDKVAKENIGNCPISPRWVEICTGSMQVQMTGLQLPVHHREEAGC
jgi:hypothetical protein